MSCYCGKTRKRPNFGIHFLDVFHERHPRFATVPCSLFTESVLLRARFPVQRFFFNYIHSQRCAGWQLMAVLETEDPEQYSLSLAGIVLQLIRFFGGLQMIAVHKKVPFFQAVLEGCDILSHAVTLAGWRF